jgi:hypothetical protein
MANNEALKSSTIEVNPRDLHLLEVNARHMRERQFHQLVENIKRDGCLTSAPLVYEVQDKLKVLSGNHRVKAAVAAGLKKIHVIQIHGDLTQARQTAIQLAHNAITGEDDQNILRSLYESLDVLEKKYSGITDTDLQLLDDPDFEKLSIGMPKYEELVLSFLPEDKDEFQKKWDEVQKRIEKTPHILARMKDYQDFFETMVRTKDTKEIVNQALAVRAMIDLASERLDQIEKETGADEADTHAGKTDEKAA